MSKPEAIAKGRYAIYQTPEGDGVITFRPDGEDQDQHQVIPGKFWKLMLSAIRGEKISLSPADLIKMMAGR